MSIRTKISSKLGSKLVMIMLLLSILPLISAIFITQRQASRALESAAQTEAVKMTELHGEMIDNKLEAIKSIIKVSSKSEALKELLIEDSNTQKTIAKKYLENIKRENNKLIEMMVLVDRNGNSLVSDTSVDMAVNVSDRDYMKEVIASKRGVFSDVIVNKETKKAIVVSAEPILDGTEVKGVLIATILFDSIKEIVDDIKIGNQGYGYLINQEGLLISHPDDKYENEKNLYGDSKELDKILKEMLAGKSGDGYYSMAGEYKYVAYAPVNGWTIASTANYDDYMAASINIRNISYIILFISSLLVIIVAVLYSKRIVNPIKKMSAAADRLAVGDIDVNLDIKSEDEIGMLAKSFKMMVANVKEQVNCAQKIAKGDLATIVNVKSEKDVLNKSLETMLISINDLVKETNALVDAAKAGRLKERGDTSRLEGGYASIVEGINDTLDAVTLPIEEAAKVLYEMSNGNLSVRVEGDYKGEHARIKDALNITIENIRNYIVEISSMLDSMSDKNYDISIENEYKGDFVKIKDSLNNIIESMNSVLGEISKSSVQVAAASGQVSQSAQDLSEGSSRQSAAIEEITASVTQVAEQTKENAQNSSKANKLSMAVQNSAEKGNSQMKEMLGAMDDINKSSVNISNIIKVIDEIAFQTNILALNAAVEAARAGEHGKGFAVVAQEVRNLAARSADAAKETTDLIENSISKVRAGTDIANETSQALDEIVAGIADAAGIFGKIAKASNEQATAISQVNEGISQISKVTQTNAATSEESAAASEEMSAQADMLEKMVSEFRLKDMQ